MKKWLHPILYGYYEIIRKTIQLRLVGFENIHRDLNHGQSVVLATPHTVLLPVIVALKGIPATFLASQSEDGGLVTYVLEQAGFKVARGSSSRGAVAGLAATLKAIEPGRAVGLTFDGPKGPPLVAKKGVTLLVKHSTGSCYLLLVTMRTRFFGLFSGFISLGSWDRFHFVLPFASVEVRALELPSKEPLAVIDFLEVNSRLAYEKLYPLDSR